MQGKYSLMSFPRLALPVIALLAVAGCSTGNNGIDVKRFHLGQPIARDTIAVIAATPAETASLEFSAYAASVANELRAAGFQPVPMGANVAYVATVKITQNVQVGPQRSSPVSVGLGGGGFSGGHGGSAVGGGVGVSFPIGKGSRDAVELDQLSVQIKRRSDSTLIWEGSATTVIDTSSAKSSLANAVPAMARALMTGFPGASGRTEHYPLK